ncbi:PREDICTED: phospholipase A1-like isoform X2 [Vollenhovia emeryi]|nr:PREDICTED: phospholipase A1-like isoform X2 [Vollenhovia emeryi]
MDCASGVNVVSVMVYNSDVKGENMSANDMCTYVNPSQQVAFVTHGFISSIQDNNFVDLATRLAEKGYTVFGVDWSQGACSGVPTFTKYEYAVTNTVGVGRRVASYIEKLVTDCHVPLANIRLIGHSLGAHVSGFASKEVQNKQLGTIPLIVAADPAGPTLGSKDCNERLCKTDCNCLKVLHTSTLYGITRPIGHLDLQFNGGSSQPDCILQSCSHTSSVSYITDTLKSKCAFPGIPMTNDSTPVYPSNTETNCILVNDNLLDTSCSIQGEYYVFVNNDTFCTENPPQKCQQ